jgi:nucleoside-diphosphate-sugar epimerase
MSPRAVVTGATGFIGGHLVRRLLRDGWEVAVLARSSSRVDDEFLRRCELVLADVDREDLALRVRRFAPDACFHLATHFVGVHGPEDVGPLVTANIELGTRLADALSASGDVAFVNTGTVWQHHDGRAYGPSSLYAATKQAFVDVLQFFAECTSLRVVTVELPDTYGPDDQRVKLLQLLARAHRTGEPLPLSPGGQLVDFVHVDDVVQALVQAVPLAGPAALSYSIGGRPMTVRDFVGLVGEVLGSDIPVEWGARGYRPREMMRPWRHFPPLPEWAPMIGLSEGLAAVLGDPAPRN